MYSFFNSIAYYFIKGIAFLFMALQVIPKKEPRPIAVSVRLSKTAAEYLKKLAQAHNMSQADVIEHLLREEWKTFTSKRAN